MCCLLLYSTLFWELSQRFFSFVPLHKWTVRILLLLPRDLSKVLSAVYFPLYYIAGENGIKFEHFNTFFKPFTICRKNRIFGARFVKGLCTFTSLLLRCTKHTPSFCARNLLPFHYYIPHFFENWAKVFSVLFFCTNEREDFCCYCQGVCRRSYQRFILPSTI